MIQETRTYTVECSREVADNCYGREQISSRSVDEQPRSITAAQDMLRGDGWVLHTDGKTTCPACLAAWEGRQETT